MSAEEDKTTHKGGVEFVLKGIAGKPPFMPSAIAAFNRLSRSNAPTRGRFTEPEVGQNPQMSSSEKLLMLQISATLAAGIMAARNDYRGPEQAIRLMHEVYAKLFPTEAGQAGE